jgi:Ca-activated chloride channel family protein
MMKDIVFAHPAYFWLLLLIPAMLMYEWLVAEKKKPQVIYSGFENLVRKPVSWRERLLSVPLWLRSAALALLIVALARPQSTSKTTRITSEGIAIMLTIDLSGSMLAEDLKPNRIEAAKKTALEFVDARQNDMIGLVIFSGEAFTQCPITTDHNMLKNMIARMKSGLLIDGTAIGEGLATAVARLKDSQAKSKVIILLTDGINNAGAIAPVTAAEIARTFGIRVYTIGVGTYGTAPYPIKTPFGTQYINQEVQIDEELMKQISSLTDGKYFRATDNKSLKKIYQEIDKLEKTKVEIAEYKRYSEEYLPWLIGSALFLLTELILRFGVIRTLP